MPACATLAAPCAGLVSTARVVDREEAGDSEELLLIASSASAGTHFLSVHINIEDVNDNAPEFAQERYSVSIGTLARTALLACVYSSRVCSCRRVSARRPAAGDRVGDRS